MSLEVWKWALSSGRVTVEMPAAAIVLTAQMQYGDPAVWALVDPAAAIVRRTFAAVQTGSPVPAGAAYVATVQLADYLHRVFHVFDLGEDRAQAAPGADSGRGKEDDGV